MKKTLFLVLICGLCLSACTSKEQDEKIHAFWRGQAMKVASNPAVMDAMMKAMMMKKPSGMSGFSMEQNFNEEEMKKAMEALKALEAVDMNNVGQMPSGARQVNAPVSVAPVRQKQAIPAGGSENAILVQALNAVKESNARSLQAYSFLKAEQQVRVKEVMDDTEAELQALVSSNTDIETFLNRQMALMDEQDRKINQILMEEISDRAE